MISSILAFCFDRLLCRARRVVVIFGMIGVKGAKGAIGFLGDTLSFLVTA
ncbi:hypothetical protein QUA40_07840 [Microcoleus sp. Pol11C3]